jgi:hypothetical protein
MADDLQGAIDRANARAPEHYLWTTPRGTEIPLTRQDLELFALIDQIFPGARAVGARRLGAKHGE